MKFFVAANPDLSKLWHIAENKALALARCGQSIVALPSEMSGEALENWKTELEARHDDYLETYEEARLATIKMLNDAPLIALAVPGMDEDEES